jgi:hypothetical protein
MHETNLNENSGDEEDASPKKQKSVSSIIRELFSRVIQQKTVQLKAGQGSKVEIMDFE